MDHDSSYTEEQEMAGRLDFQRRLQAALDNLPPALDAAVEDAFRSATEVWHS